MIETEMVSEWKSDDKIPTISIDTFPGIEDVVILPSGDVTITNCADKLFKRIAPTRTLFIRGGIVTCHSHRDDGLIQLEILKPAAARSLFEKYAKLFVWRKTPAGDQFLMPTVCPQQMADALLQSQEARNILPTVVGLLNCPILREVDGVLKASGRGYDEPTKLLITGGDCPPDVELKKAVSSLLELLSEFDFDSKGDKSRAIASLIAPALKFGGFIKGRIPADVAEADKSQSGKTYRQKLTAAIYNEKVSLVTNREGGVGSVDESLNQRLIEGRPFIQFDNFRGRFSSPHLEAFLTADGDFPCRVPHRGEVNVQADRFFVFLSSNGVDTTRDFANRSAIIRIKKKPEGYVYRKYTAGDSLAHVRAAQPYYMGCIFAVIKAWHAAGCPRTEETRHDFREWVQIVDWIVQKIFGGAPVMEGHREAQENVSTPGLIFLRSVAMAVAENDELEIWLSATDIFRLCESSFIPVPGLRDGVEESKAARVIGTTLGKVFSGTDVVTVGGFQVERQEHEEQRTDGQGSFKQKQYRVKRL